MYYFSSQKILTLTTDDIYNLADEFNLTFSQCSCLVKKCYALAIELDDGKSFAQFYKDYLQYAPQVIVGEEFRIEVSNPLLLELYQRLLRKNHIYQDYSFNKNSVVIAVDKFVDLIDENGKASDFTVEKGLYQKIEQYLSKDEKEKIQNSVGLRVILLNIAKNVSSNVAVNVISQVVIAFITKSFGF